MNENIFRLFCFIFYSILFCSCKFSVDEPVKDYLEYWSSTCHVAEVQYGSPFVSIGGLPNFPTTNEVEINLITVNPKGYRLLCGPGGSCFSFSNDSGDLEYADYSETLSDTSMIKVRAKFSDEFEGQTITLSGCLWPENKVAFSEADLKTMNPELFYSTQFVLNTPPDRPRNLTNPTEPEVDGYHCFHFIYPDQSLNRNQNLTYVVDCYYYDAGSFRYVAGKTLTAADSKGSSATEFVYYFDEQVPDLQYDYVVTAYSPRGLHCETVSTNAALGASYVTDPVIEFSGGLFNEKTAKKNGVKYDIYEYSAATVTEANVTAPTVTVTNTAEGADMVVKLDDAVTSPNFSLRDGFHTITVRISKNLCKPVNITKHVYIIKSLTEPEITYSNGEKTTRTQRNEADGKDYEVAQYRYLNNIDNIKMSITNSYTETDCEMELVIDGGETITEKITDRVMEDGFHTIKMTVKSDYCKDLEVTKYIYINIKPVKVTFKDSKIIFRGDDAEGGNGIDLRGAIYTCTDDTGQQTIWEETGKTGMGNSTDVSMGAGQTLWLNSKTSKFYIYTGAMEEIDTGLNGNDWLGKMNKGQNNATRTLEALKENKSFWRIFPDGKSSESGDWFNLTFELVLDDSY